MATVAHLWEVDHPYYCNEGNFFRRGLAHRYDSWRELHAEWGGNDPDLNLVFRWDWKRYEADELGAESEELTIFWMLQRKGMNVSTSCPVTAEDEPSVRAWLEERAKTLRAIWAPIDLGADRA